jgi:mono/diheme cytochrome c family protein
MPAFGQKLSDAQRWDLVNFIRTLAQKAQSENQNPIFRIGLKPSQAAP